MNRDIAAAYLAAMIDGEGTVTHVGRQHRVIKIANTEGAILDAIEQSCQALGIACRRKAAAKREGRKPCWSIHIFGRENFLKVYAAMPFDTLKRRKLAVMIGSYVRVAAPVMAGMPHLDYAPEERTLTVDNFDEIADWCGGRPALSDRRVLVIDQFGETGEARIGDVIHRDDYGEFTIRTPEETR